jgi:multidrug efflux pump
MVLAIGMVVDDAIIVLENIHRHIEDGMKPFDAAIKGARELGLPVIAMTITLVAVYLPIGFIGGLTGTLFVEFAFALAGAVLLSGVIALTLSPMMCARLLRPRDEGGGHGLEMWLDRQFDRLRHTYQRRLHGALNDKQVIALFGVIVLVSTYFLYMTSPRELAPEEDQGIILIFSQSDPYSSLDYLTLFTNELTTIANALPEKENYFQMNGVGGSGSAVGTNTAISGIVFKPWAERDRTTRMSCRKSSRPPDQSRV